MKDVKESLATAGQMNRGPSLDLLIVIDELETEEKLRPQPYTGAKPGGPVSYSSVMNLATDCLNCKL